MKREILEALEDSPVIAAIKDDNGLEKCVESDIMNWFLNCSYIYNSFFLHKEYKYVIMHIPFVVIMRVR